VAEAGGQRVNLSRSMTGDRETIAQCCGEVLSLLHDQSWGEAEAFSVRLALEEAILNAVKHGHLGDTQRTICVDVCVAPDLISIVVADEGRGFDPASVPDPTRPENLHIPSGRGLALMRAYMSAVTVCPPGNRIEMELRRS
jgi:serine/threonine-protein kinase RsbW